MICPSPFLSLRAPFLSLRAKRGNPKKLILLLLIFFPQICFSSFSSKDKGTTTAGFLKLGVGARAAAMGEAYAAAANEASALYWNPAALLNLDKRSATFMHAAYIESTFFDYLAYGQPLKNGSAFGLGIQYLSAGSIKRTDATGTEIGTFKPSDMAATVGYAKKLFGLSLGIGAKFIQSKIIDSASAFAVDLGVLHSGLAQDKLDIALTATNIGSKMKFNVEKEDLPMALRLGSRYQVTGAWQSSLDIGFPKDNEAYFGFGTEYVFSRSEARSFAGRAGYNSRTTSDVDDLTGLSLGLGFAVHRASFDYAFVPFGEVGSAHRLSLSFTF